MKLLAKWDVLWKPFPLPNAGVGKFSLMAYATLICLLYLRFSEIVKWLLIVMKICALERRKHVCIVFVCVCVYMCGCCAYVCMHMCVCACV